MQDFDKLSETAVGHGQKIGATRSRISGVRQPTEPLRPGVIANF